MLASNGVKQAVYVPRNESRYAFAGSTMCLNEQSEFRRLAGKGGRTHLVSPAMAAAAAVEGRFVDIREWKYR